MKMIVGTKFQLKLTISILDQICPKMVFAVKKQKKWLLNSAYSN